MNERFDANEQEPCAAAVGINRVFSQFHRSINIENHHQRGCKLKIQKERVYVVSRMDRTLRCRDASEPKHKAGQQAV